MFTESTYIILKHPFGYSRIKTFCDTFACGSWNGSKFIIFTYSNIDGFLLSYRF